MSVYYNSINKERIKFLKTAKETNGYYSEIEVKLAPGGGNPVHFHKRFTEHFYAINGELGLHYNGREIILEEGAEFAVSPMNDHRFYNPNGTKSIIFKTKIIPGNTDFENFLKTQFGLVNDSKTFGKLQIPKNAFYLAVLLKWGDIQSDTLAYKLGKPFINVGFKFAQLLGLEEKLKEKYC